MLSALTLRERTMIWGCAKQAVFTIIILKILKKGLTNCFKRDIMYYAIICSLKYRGCSSMVERQPSKLAAWVRFPSPAPRKNALRMGRMYIEIQKNTLYQRVSCAPHGAHGLKGAYYYDKQG